MPKRPNVGAIAEQLIERLKQVEDQVTQNQRIADELGRLRDAVTDLERAIRSRSPSQPSPPQSNAPPSAHAQQRAPALPNA
jgi:hypothetical protein